MSAYIINGCGRQIRTEPLGYEPKMLPITLPRYIIFQYMPDILEHSNVSDYSNTYS